MTVRVEQHLEKRFERRSMLRLERARGAIAAVEERELLSGLSSADQRKAENLAWGLDCRAAGVAGRRSRQE